MPTPSETETNKTLWGGFLFAARVAEHLHSTGVAPTLSNCISIMGQVADGHLSLTDPERAGAGFDAPTKQLLREGSLDSVTRDVTTAQRIRDGLNFMVDSVKDA